METRGTEAPPLSEDELAVWSALVERGREIRRPMHERRDAERAENQRRMAEARGRTDVAKWASRPKGRGSDPDAPIPDPVRRFVVFRASGMSFSEAGAAAGCTWSDVNMARMRSEDMMCAIEGMEESSRFLMRSKAMSVLERSQDEGARVNGAQLAMSESILKRLDHAHFGDALAKVVDQPQEQAKAVGGGGFVINVIADAAKVADAAPAGRPGKALVFTDV